MTSRDFAYWLQGFFELSSTKTLNTEQTATIKRHLALVFIHDIDPAQGDAKQQKILQTIHDIDNLLKNSPQHLHLSNHPLDDMKVRC